MMAWSYVSDGYKRQALEFGKLIFPEGKLIFPEGEKTMLDNNMDEEIAKLAAKIYDFYFTKDGGYLELDPNDPRLVHIRAQCWKHAIAFYAGEDNADIKRSLTTDPIV